MPKKMTEEEKFIKSKIVTKQMEKDFNDSVLNNTKDCIVIPLYLRNELKTKPDKTLAMNLNPYMHRHPFQINDIKKRYHAIVGSQLKGLKLEGQYKLHYKLYRKNKFDGSNVYSIIDKFFCDALQEHGVILDDDIETIVSGEWVNGGQDKIYPRGEVYFIKQ